jgi:hypothetical protein
MTQPLRACASSCGRPRSRLAARQRQLPDIRVARGRVGGGGPVADRSRDDRPIVGRSRRTAPEPGVGHPAELAHLLRAVSAPAMIACYSGPREQKLLNLRAASRPTMMTMLLRDSEPSGERRGWLTQPARRCRASDRAQGKLSTRRRFRVPESPSEPTALCVGARIAPVGPSEGRPSLPRLGRN